MAKQGGSRRKPATDAAENIKVSSAPKALIKPTLPGGFRDALPEDMIAKNAMMDTIRGVFERFGFDPMETPAVECTETLTGGDEESDRIIFRVAPAVRGEVKDMARDKTSLRFDLTVPLARVLAANPEIPKPFKRYQIGKIWRGERPQFGRYREFTQMDIDTIGATSLDADAEIIQVIYETLQALGVDKFVIRINDKRDVLRRLIEFGIPKERERKTLIAIDKKDKMSPEEWETAVAEASGIGLEKTKEYLWKISGENGLEESAVGELRLKTEKLGVPQSYLRYDAALVRGFSYYTGSIFEVALLEIPEIGSVFGGGRFDGLTARFSTQALPAVGASIGVDRLFAALERLGKIKKQKTLTEVLVFDLGEAFEDRYIEFLTILRKSGVGATKYLGEDKAFQAQLAYAVKQEIPYALIYGDKEKDRNVVQLKNLQSNTQQEIAIEKLEETVKTAR